MLFRSISPIYEDRYRSGSGGKTANDLTVIIIAFFCTFQRTSSLRAWAENQGTPRRLTPSLENLTASHPGGLMYCRVGNGVGGRRGRRGEGGDCAESSRKEVVTERKYEQNGT